MSRSGGNHRYKFKPLRKTKRSTFSNMGSLHPERLFNTWYPVEKYSHLSKITELVVTLSKLKQHHQFARRVDLLTVLQSRNFCSAIHGKRPLHRSQPNPAHRQTLRCSSSPCPIAESPSIVRLPLSSPSLILHLHPFSLWWTVRCRNSELTIKYDSPAPSRLGLGLG